MSRIWSDTEHRFGPFVFDNASIYTVGAQLVSRGDDEDESRRTSLRLFAFGKTLIVMLPGFVLRPYAEKVYPRGWDAATIERLGRDWYWQIDERQFGATVSEGHLHVTFGRQTHDSSTTQSWGCFLPWTQWRLVRHHLLNIDGTFFADLRATKDWREQQAMRDAQPTVDFTFRDYDGEKLVATCSVEEWASKFGTGWFKWLSLFRKDRVRRSLDIRYSGEVGRRKGSWKGGTIGTSINMLPGETANEAFLRHCELDGLAYGGEVLK